MKERYTTTDEAIEVLQKKLVKRFRRAKSKIRLAEFDRIDVITEVEKLYTVLDNDFRENMLELALLIYDESIAEASEYGYEKISSAGSSSKSAKSSSESAKNSSKSKKEIKNLISVILDTPDSITKYAYSTELYRKRDRLSEALETRSDTAYEWKRAMSLWAQMVTQYADIVTDNVVIETYKECGVKEVRWVTQQDGKVCKKCDELGGNVYPIDKAPGKQHWKCRCYYIPVKRDIRR